MSEQVEIWKAIKEHGKAHRNKVRESETEKIRTLSKQYEVVEITIHQFRFLGAKEVIDIFPTNKKYHNITKNKRGYYRNLEQFLKSVYGKQDKKEV